jgi:hypothetical protein
MTDAVNNACKVLREAAATFRDYGDHHRSRSTTESIVKAKRNDDMAEECEKALADLRLVASGDERFG